MLKEEINVLKEAYKGHFANLQYCHLSFFIKNYLVIQIQTPCIYHAHSRNNSFHFLFSEAFLFRNF